MKAEVIINWNEIGHQIEGFGVFAGWAEPFFTDNNRDTLLDSLFSQDYLNLNIIRAKVYDSFSTAEGNINFHLDANIDVKPGDPDYPKPGSDDMIQRGQLWILKKALERYPSIDKIMASTWSPPIYMKTQPKAEGNFYNRLNKKYMQEYADYLAEFAKQFSDAGIPIYALSPMNEPEFINCSWDGCFWSPLAVASIAFALKEALNSKQCETKVIISENGNWSITDFWLALSIAVIKIKNIFKREVCLIDILASHGYTGLTNPGDLNTSPLSWLLTHTSKPKWITEASSAVDGNLGMEMGLKLAESIHNFVYNQGVSAYIYWLGVVKSSNESLINSDGNTYSFNKTYDVMGNYSKFVQPGFIKLGSSTDKPDTGLYVSAFKSSDDAYFSSVVINKNIVEKTLYIKIDHDIDSLTPYLTTSEEGVRWQKGEDLTKNLDGEFVIQIPDNSVITITTLPSN